MRVVVERGRSGRGCRPGRAGRPRGARACLRAHALVRRRPSAICRPTVSTGLSEVIGSWNTMPTPRPRSGREPLGAGAEQLLAASRRSPGRPCAGGGGSRPSSASTADALAAAGLPDDREGLARRDVELDAR